VKQRGDDEEKIEYQPSQVTLQSLKHKGEIQQTLGGEIEIPVEHFDMSKEENSQNDARNSLKKPEKSAAGGNRLSHAMPPASFASKIRVEFSLLLNFDRRIIIEK